jgi:hypothetical protein
MPRSTVYYHFKRLQIPTRSKSDAQKKHLETNGHQRLGRTHSLDVKDRISNSRRSYWDSEKGVQQKEELRQLRAREWEDKHPDERARIVSRLRDAPRPGAGELSRFGRSLVSFLREKQVNLTTGIPLTAGHVSDIILLDRSVVVELLLPISVYGEQQAQRVHRRYEKLTAMLNGLGYRVVIIEDKSNTDSLARCKRVYEQLLDFFSSSEQNMKIVS